MEQLANYQRQKIIIELKYLLELANQDKQSITIQIINKIYPFTQWPLNSLPPLQLITCPQQTIISKNLLKDFQSYCYVIIKGRIIIKKGSFQHNEDRFIHPDIKQKLLFNIDEQTELHVLPNTIYMKIHQIWVDMAKTRQQKQIYNYIRNKLMSIPFFSKLSFNEFNCYCEKAFLKTLGPGDILLGENVVPYHMYVVAEGELIYVKNIKFTKDQQLWNELNYQLQHHDDTSQKMLEHLVKNPKIDDETFDVKFQIKSVVQGDIFCGKQTLDQEKLKYSIQSTLKTKVICVKYPDLYVLSEEKLAEIRTWIQKEPHPEKVRKQYYYNIKWKEYRQFLNKQSTLNKWSKHPFQDYLRKDVNLNGQRYQYMAGKVKEGEVIDSPAGMVVRLKSMI